MKLQPGPGPSPTTLPVYVINLDRRPDRWAAMSEQLDRLGIEAERVPAVDGRLLETNRSAWGLDKGAVACIRSHRKALDAFLDTPAPAALILEDDAELAADTPQLLGSVDWWPSGSKIVRLHESTAIHSSADPCARRRFWLRGVSGHTPSGRDMRRLDRWATCSAAYLIDREGARIVRDHLEAPDQLVDYTLFDLRYSKTARKLRPVQVIPAMAREMYGPEDSDLKGAPEPPGNEVRRGLRRRRRRMRSLSYRLSFNWRRALGLSRRTIVSYRAEPARP